MTAGSKKVGKYDILEVIGRGGMGIIYRGVDPSIGRIVAIKMMTGGFAENPELLQRFYREAQSAGKLQHPNIVTIYDLGVQDANPYLVMEFLDGESLEAVLRTQRVLLLEEKLDIVLQVCEGIGYAHQRHIVHRDIKPGNVMLLHDGIVKIVDFGIARIGDKSMTRTGQIMGSIQYMSPEQINGGNVDARSDIFAIGVLLYQLLTNALPFEGKDTGETLLKIIHEPPPPLSKFLSSYPADLEPIIERVLAKDRELRFQAAEDLGFELSHIQETLRRERASEYLRLAEEAHAAGQLNRAKEQLLQVLKIDRQDAKASTLLRLVQQGIQKQQRGQQARDLQSEAERAVARGELAEAMEYLDRAIDLDRENTELSNFRDSVRESKARRDKLQQLLHRAEMAQDAGDLDEARNAADAALAIDGNSTEVRSLHAAISHEIAERDKQIELQKYLGEARRHISSRHFTAALQVLKQVESIDPAVPGIQELIGLAVSGQQQEKKRQDLELLTSEIEDALNSNDYERACAKAEEGLRTYSDDRGLKKLKAVADKERIASEKRKFVESKIGAARKLLEDRKSEAALASLEDALKKYPNELPLQSMVAMITEMVEREHAEQKKAEVIQKAKDAIRRRDYTEAISLLEAARQEAPSVDYDDLLQFAQDEAISYARRQKIDSVAEHAHQLSSAERFEEAIELLETTLQELPDQELDIILSDIRRHLADFNHQVQEAINNAIRLQRQDRYADAVRFLEAQPYAQSNEFNSALAEARDKQQRWQELCTARDQIRAAIDCSDLERAQRLYEQCLERLGKIADLQTLEQEIQSKKRQVANAAIERAIRDTRVLLLVRSYDSASGVLARAAPFVDCSDPELKIQFQALAELARAGSAQQHPQFDQKAQNQSTVEEVWTRTLQGLPNLESLKALDLDDETQPADTIALRDLLGQVTHIGESYPEDAKVQTAIDALKHKISSRISALRDAELTKGPWALGFPGQEPEVASSTRAGPNEVTPSNPQDLRLDTQPASNVPETFTSVATPPFGLTKVEQPTERSVPSSQQAVPNFVPAQPSEVIPGIPGTEDQASATSESDRRRVVEPEGSASWQSVQPPTPVKRVFPGVDEARRRAGIDKVPPVIYQPRPLKKTGFATGITRSKGFLALVISAVAILVGFAVVHWSKPRPQSEATVPSLVKPSNPALPGPSKPPLDTISARQQAAIDAANKLIAAGDLAGAKQKLEQAADLAGPLSASAQQKLTTVDQSMKDQALRQLRQSEEQLWERAMNEADAGRFTQARKDLRRIVGLGDGGQRKAEAERYLSENIPLREKEQGLLAQAQQLSRSTAPVDLQRAMDVLNEVISLNGPHKSEAENLRSSIGSKLQERASQAKPQEQTRQIQQTQSAGLNKSSAINSDSSVNRQIQNLNAEIDSRLRNGDFAGAREQLDKIRQLGGDVTSASRKIDQEQTRRQAQIDAEAVFQKAVQRYQHAVGSNNRSELESAREDLENIVKAGGPHTTEAANDANQITQQLAKLDTPAVPPPSKVPLPPAADLQEVRSVIQRYIDAFEHKDADALQQVWPTLGVRYSKYKESFTSASSIRMKLQTENIDIAADAATAVATTVISLDYTPKGQRTQTRKNRTVFQLSKLHGTWRIDDVKE